MLVALLWSSLFLMLEEKLKWDSTLEDEPYILHYWFEILQKKDDFNLITKIIKHASQK